MLDRREHRREIFGVRETQGKALGSHRAELNESRRAWQRARDARCGLHRTALEGERRDLRETRRCTVRCSRRTAGSWRSPSACSSG